MIVSLIVAADEAGGIGIDNGLPWRLPDDLKRFKALTMGHHLILGRKTWESIGRPLPGREMIVLSRQPGYQPEGCRMAGSLEQALEMARSMGESEVFVIGGAKVFAQALPLADRLYLTRVHARLPADTYFPAMDLNAWRLYHHETHPADERHPYAFTEHVYERIW
jgi:dihydrofolate reductase